ncbi:unnamed protein product [Ostreobium quekettii]|uniref:Uncharacterized protein n=1 Tax=Ostreobium quekettii TaxID=121088 RepID=A0A8S1IR85_9CHLO|nr:unnamed protein product [Ostreobium quekettii]|eukprot:evm.model.scf_191.2 EVM.evm.TU.scf_191.2   scf_191:17828-19351(-)
MTAGDHRAAPPAWLANSFLPSSSYGRSAFSSEDGVLAECGLTETGLFAEVPLDCMDSMGCMDIASWVDLTQHVAPTFDDPATFHALDHRHPILQDAAWHGRLPPIGVDISKKELHRLLLTRSHNGTSNSSTLSTENALRAGGLVAEIPEFREQRREAEPDVVQASALDKSFYTEIDSSDTPMNTAGLSECQRGVHTANFRGTRSWPTTSLGASDVREDQSRDFLCGAPGRASAAAGEPAAHARAATRCRPGDALARRRGNSLNRAVSGGIPEDTLNGEDRSRDSRRLCGDAGSARSKEAARVVVERPIQAVSLRGESVLRGAPELCVWKPTLCPRSVWNALADVCAGRRAGVARRFPDVAPDSGFFYGTGERCLEGPGSNFGGWKSGRLKAVDGSRGILIINGRHRGYRWDGRGRAVLHRQLRSGAEAVGMEKVFRVSRRVPKDGGCWKQATVRAPGWATRKGDQTRGVKVFYETRACLYVFKTVFYGDVE